MSRSRARHLPAFQLMAYPPAALAQPMQAARELLESSPAAITDIRVYSDKLVVFQLSLPLADWPLFVGQVLASGLGVEAPGEGPAETHADQDGDVPGTFSVALRGDGGGDTRDIIPAVPG